VDYPGRLAAAGLAEPGTLYRYAVGRIVVWSPRESGADPAALDIRALARPAVRKIAIANPKHAPYGRAAVAALKHYGIYEAVADRLVLGESVSQAAQFVESRSADAGIIANSLALSPRMAARGRCREIPASAHPPIEQAVIILKSSQRKAAALAFLEYLRSPEAAEKWRRWGFARPAQEPEKR
jgi:molybdate transport system substrate-binding protein